MLVANTVVEAGWEGDDKIGVWQNTFGASYPVLKYSRAEWMGKHIPEMAPEAKLRPEQIAALESYIRATCPR